MTGGAAVPGNLSGQGVPTLAALMDRRVPA